MSRYKSVVAINSSVFLFMLGVGMIVALLPQRILSMSGAVSDVGYLASAYAVSNILKKVNSLEYTMLRSMVASWVEAYWGF
jgi:hypothetical protein